MGDTFDHFKAYNRIIYRRCCGGSKSLSLSLDDDPCVKQDDDKEGKGWKTLLGLDVSCSLK